MAMMRRGPLAQYSAAWVLRQASDHHTTGSVEFHTQAPLTLYLRAGALCHGMDGVPATGFVAGTEDEHPDEATARTRTVDLLARALDASDGWYYLDPLGHHDGAGPWSWDTATLIQEARVRTQASGGAAPSGCAETPGAEATSGGPLEPVDRAVALEAPEPARAPRRVRLTSPADGGQVMLSAESWKVVCALASERDALDLGRLLSWPVARLDAALTELDAAGVLCSGPEPRPTPVAPGPACPRSAVLDTSAPPGDRGEPPTVPPRPAPRAGASAERRGALRRLISTLKPA
jgi:hypothetical protein